MTSKYHVVSIDNDYGHINDVILYSSHDTKQEATKALEVIHRASQQSHVDKANRENDNYQRYLKWASKAIIECPNQYGGLNWIKHPGDPNHLSHIQSIPYHTVKQHDGWMTISHNLIQVKSNKPLRLLKELVIPLKHYLEYHLVEPKAIAIQ